MNKFRQLFSKKCSVIAMVHAAALPGTPRYGGSLQKIIDKACKETEVYLNNNDGLLVENMHDIPYLKSKYFGPEVTAFMTAICLEVRKLVPKTVPCGIQILAAGNKEAIAVAKATSFNFIRSEGFVYSHIGDEGFIDADAGLILRYRKKIDAENILIFTDIKKKHSSHSITEDVSLVETANAAEFFLSDGLVLTGTSTGKPADVNELHALKNHCSLPVIVGSGVTLQNVDKYLEADAFIIGSYFKNNGIWYEDLNNKKIKNFMDFIKNYLKLNSNIVIN